MRSDSDTIEPPLPAVPGTAATKPWASWWLPLIARLKLAARNFLDQDRTPAVLFSLTVHALILLLLALLTFPPQFGGQELSLIVGFQASAPTETEELVLLESDQSASAAPSVQFDNQRQPRIESHSGQVSALEPIAIELEGAQEPGSLSLTDPLAERLQQLSNWSLTAGFVHMGVEGRRLEHRTETALKRGGTLESEQAVEAALEWLAAHQAGSGAWPLNHDHGDCQGRCKNPGTGQRFEPAGTGLALLAFFGAGYTHFDGKYQQQVRRGIYFLRQVLEDTPQGYSFLHSSDSGMYNHGIAAFALCEAYQMTGDPDLKEVCQRAIDFIVSAQSYQGGWGYLPKQPGDLTISGWQMMALKSAAAARLEVPPANVWRMVNFLGTQRAEDQVTYFYRTPDEQSMACTAIGILMRLFLGDPWTDPNILKGLSSIASHDDYGRDIYFRYYTTLALFHAGGPLWEQWNQKCRDYLIATQSQQGHEAGSWYFEDQFGKVGGRLYTTAMAAMTLEVYYRYSPLYQQSDRPFEL
jgi:hypothetical protein